jgi:Tannase and feruloyl esterase
VLITGLDPLRDARLDTPVPVACGCATRGTDSGHDNAKLPEAFALNAEALENYAYASYKKVRDTAIAIARAYYGMTPRRIYYSGGSEDGREGITMAQRFPTDFDGIVSTVPAINFTALLVAGVRNSIALMGDGWLTPAKVKTLHKPCSMLAIPRMASRTVSLAATRHAGQRSIRKSCGARTGATMTNASPTRKSLP